MASTPIGFSTAWHRPVEVAQCPEATGMVAAGTRISQLERGRYAGEELHVECQDLPDKRASRDESQERVCIHTQS